MDRILEFLKLHHDAYFAAKPYADETKHPAPSDSKAWSQILISLLTGIPGLAREKGADLADGSDVKAANTWDAIDTPRFNGVIKAGTKHVNAGKLASLDEMPYLFFVLWDNEPLNKHERCRVWVVQTRTDKLFREMCEKWYNLREEGKISSSNFQLHPPRGKDSNEIRNTCGNLSYPLLLKAEWIGNRYEIQEYNPDFLKHGFCAAIV